MKSETLNPKFEIMTKSEFLNFVIKTLGFISAFGFQHSDLKRKQQ